MDLRIFPLFIRLKSRKEMQVSRDFKLTEEEINRAIMRSPYALPNSPGQMGLSASQIKKYFYDFIRSLAGSLNIHLDDINLSVSELDELINKINERLGEIEPGENTSDGNEGTGSITSEALEAHNSSAEAHTDIREELSIARTIGTRALNIAKGKNRIHVFVSIASMFNFIDIHRYYEDYGNSDFESIDEGDIFIIAEKDTPEFAVLKLARYEDEQTQDISKDDIASTEFKSGGVYYYTKKNITLVGMEGGADTSSILNVSQVQEQIALHSEDKAAHNDIREQISLKQNKLTAGDNIEISDDGVISASAGTGEGVTVDISGKLDKKTSVTEFSQAYVKKADGTQGLVDIKSSGSVPTSDELVTGNVIATEMNTFARALEQMYQRKDDSIVIRDANGAITVDYAENPTDAVPKHYVDALVEELRSEIEAGLDSIIAIQNSLIGGDA